MTGEDATEMMGPQHASIATTQGGSFAANAISVWRFARRHKTTAPDASRPTTLQTFLPRATPRTEISIPIPPPEPPASPRRRKEVFHKHRHAHSLFGFPPAHPNPPKRARTTGQVVRYLHRTYRLLPTAALGTAF